MLLNLSHIGQIALPVIDVDRAETFYEHVIGLRKLYRFGDLSFFDCAGVRLLLEKTHDPAGFRPQGCIYLRCADIALTVAMLQSRGVAFTHRPHCIAKNGPPRPVDGVLSGPGRPHAGGDAGSAERLRAVSLTESTLIATPDQRGRQDRYPSSASTWRTTGRARMRW
jgi:methylmalonyl-CoA/ethylmalonyl-CoA epimerase